MESSSNEPPKTWHYGLIARWWAEFNTAAPAELAYYRAVIETYGQPALDLACGAGRLLIPLAGDGFDVDGVDLSPDMLAQAASIALSKGLSPGLHASALHEMNLSRRYRTIYCCDSFGLGGQRAHDELAMRRAYEHLEPGGAFVFNHYLPYDEVDKERWADWLPEHRPERPNEWRESGDRRALADGDEIELIGRYVDFDPLLQRYTREMRAILRRDGEVIAIEENVLQENVYFAQELVLMLRLTGFVDIRIEGLYNGRPAGVDDSTVVVIAQRPDA
ncbi:MAG: methyltransferase domain-containing protein [Chloroflexota bacterium]